MHESTAYTGHVEPGGPPAIRSVADADGQRVQIRKQSVGPMDNNAYLLVDPSAGNAVLIDAAAEPTRLSELVADVQVDAVVTTHRHADHWQALEPVAEMTGAPVLAGREDAAAIDHPVDRRLHDGDTVEVGAVTLEVRHTPGHTPGSICLLLRGADGAHHLFTGDTLFPGGPGNTFGDADAFRQIMESLRQRVFDLPDTTWVYPGHGDDTTLGAERPHLDEWEQRGW